MRSSPRQALLLLCAALAIVSVCSVEVLRPAQSDAQVRTSFKRHLSSRPELVDNALGSEYLPDITTFNYNGEHPNERRTCEGCQDTATKEPLRISFVTTPLENKKGQGNSIVDANIDIIMNEVLPAIKETWSKYLSVAPVQYETAYTGSVCFGFFQKHFTGEVVLPEIADLGIIVGGEDTLYTSGGLTSPVCTPGTLAVAKACNLDQFERPVLGFINVCIDDDAVYTDEQIQTAKDVAIHEIAHVLGMDSTLMMYFRDPVTLEPLTPRPFIRRDIDCVDGTTQKILFPSEKTLMPGITPKGLRYHNVVTNRVTRVARNHLDCQSLQGARLENQPTSASCSGNHWDERLFSSEIMSSIYDGKSYNAVSPLTLGLLEDSSWYQVNYAGAALSPVGHGLGCDYANNNCIVNDQVPAWGKDVYCDTPATLEDNYMFSPETPLYCDPTHTRFGYCDLFHIEDTFVNTETNNVRYFTDQTLVSTYAQGDFCPMAVMDIGVDCTSSSSVDLSFYAGEVMGKTSKCINAYFNYDGTGSVSTASSRPACLITKCNEFKKKVEVNDRICENDFDLITLGPGHVFECPRLSTVCPHFFCSSACSGRGRCDFASKSCTCDDASDTSVDCNGGLDSSQDSGGIEPPPPQNILPAVPRATDSPTASRTTAAPIVTDAPLAPTKRPSKAPQQFIFFTPTAAPSIAEKTFVVSTPTAAPSVGEETEKTVGALPADEEAEKTNLTESINVVQRAPLTETDVPTMTPTTISVIKTDQSNAIPTSTGTTTTTSFMHLPLSLGFAIFALLQ